MNNVFSFDPEAIESERRKLELLEVLEFIKGQIEEGNIKEFAACSLDKAGTVQIHVAALDMPGAVGLFEIGKHILITQEQDDE